VSTPRPLSSTRHDRSPCVTSLVPPSQRGVRGARLSATGPTWWGRGHYRGGEAGALLTAPLGASRGAGVITTRGGEAGALPTVVWGVENCRRPLCAVVQTVCSASKGQKAGGEAPLLSLADSK
jgi:hypothetical protein